MKDILPSCCAVAGRRPKVSINIRTEACEKMMRTRKCRLRPRQSDGRDTYKVKRIGFPRHNSLTSSIILIWINDEKIKVSRWAGGRGGRVTPLPAPFNISPPRLGPNQEVQMEPIGPNQRLHKAARPIFCSAYLSVMGQTAITFARLT